MFECVVVNVSYNHKVTKKKDRHQSSSVFYFSAAIEETSRCWVEITHLGFLTVRKPPGGNSES